MEHPKRSSCPGNKWLPSHSLKQKFHGLPWHMTSKNNHQNLIFFHYQTSRLHSPVSGMLRACEFESQPYDIALLEIMIMKYFLWLFSCFWWFKNGSCLLLVNHFRGLCLPRNSRSRLTDLLNMIIIGWLDCKITKQHYRTVTYI